MTAAKKAVFIGLDGMTLDLLQSFSEEGLLPNLRRAMERGVVTEAFASLPAGTSINWNTLSTGAYAGTHGVTGMSLHAPDDLRQQWSAFFSHNCRAEYIWDAAERAGKKPILLKYTTSWPPTVRKGIQVEGFADPAWSAVALAPRAMWATYDLAPHGPHQTTPPPRTRPMGFRVQPQPAEGWQNLPATSLPPLEVILRTALTEGTDEEHYTLLYASAASGYDRVAIGPRRDYATRWADLAVNQRGPQTRTAFTVDGKRREGTFMYRLLSLSPDGKEFALYRTQIYPTTGWTIPDHLGEELIREAGLFVELGGLTGVMPWMAEESFQKLLLEEYGYQGQWLCKAARYLLTNYDWDLFYTQYHAIDLADHYYLSCLRPEPILPRFQKIGHEAGARIIRAVYKMSDDYVGAILEHCDEETLVVISSDHGQTEVHGSPSPVPFLNRVLEQAGFLTYKEEQPPLPPPEEGTAGPPESLRIDWTKTKAASLTGHEGFVYINLKGRYGHGIVEPEDYEAVRKEVIQALEEARSPEHPEERLYQFVWPREDAEIFGLWDEQVGDVVCEGKVHLIGSHHGNFHASRDDIGSMRACTIFLGPGLKKGYERPRPINLVDVVPTIAHFAGLPTPRESEGRILWDLLEGWEGKVV